MSVHQPQVSRAISPAEKFFHRRSRNSWTLFSFPPKLSDLKSLTFPCLCTRLLLLSFMSIYLSPIIRPFVFSTLIITEPLCTRGEVPSLNYSAVVLHKVWDSVHTSSLYTFCHEYHVLKPDHDCAFDHSKPVVQKPAFRSWSQLFSSPDCLFE